MKLRANFSSASGHLGFKSMICRKMFYWVGGGGGGKGSPAERMEEKSSGIFVMEMLST